MTNTNHDDIENQLVENMNTSSVQLSNILLIYTTIFVLLVPPSVVLTFMLYTENSECANEERFGRVSVMDFLFILTFYNMSLAILFVYTHLFVVDKTYMYKSLGFTTLPGVIIIDFHSVFTCIGWTMFTMIDKEKCDNFTYTYYLTSLILLSISIGTIGTIICSLRGTHYTQMRPNDMC